MHVIVDKPRLAIDLQEFLRDIGFIAAQPRGAGLDVSIPGASDSAQTRRVVNVYLAIWQAIHPGVQAQIVERDERASSVASGFPSDSQHAAGHVRDATAE